MIEMIERRQSDDRGQETRSELNLTKNADTYRPEAKPSCWNNGNKRGEAELMIELLKVSYPIIPRYLTFKITLLDIYATLYYVLCLVKPRRNRVAWYNDNKRWEAELIIELLKVSYPIIPRYLTFKITLLDIYATLQYVLCLVKPRRNRVAWYIDNKRWEAELVIELLNVSHDSQYFWHPFGIDWDNRSASVGQSNCFSGTIELSRSSGTIKVSLLEIGLVSVGQSYCVNGTIDLSQLDN